MSFMITKIENNDTKLIIKNLLSKEVWDFVATDIINNFNALLPMDWSLFSSHDIKTLYSKRDELVKELMKIRKIIGHPEYLNRMQKIDNEYPTYKDITRAEHREIIATYGYEIDPELKKSYLDKMWSDIQKWWSNAQWVFLIANTDLVAVVKGEGSYVYELPQRTLTQRLAFQNVPQVIDVFVHEWKTYKIMKKSLGIQLDKMMPWQLSAIPQSHYDQFLADIKKIESAWLKIDPSKASNFFYDEKIWFCFIDLWVKEKWSNWSMFDYIGNFNAHNYLDADKLQSAWDRR